MKYFILVCLLFTGMCFATEAKHPGYINPTFFEDNWDSNPLEDITINYPTDTVTLTFLEDNSILIQNGIIIELGKDTDSFILINERDIEVQNIDPNNIAGSDESMIDHTGQYGYSSNMPVESSSQSIFPIIQLNKTHTPKNSK